MSPEKSPEAPLPTLIGYWDRELRNRMANPNYRDFFGRTAEEMSNIHMRDLLGPELFEENLAVIQGVLDGHPQIFEREIETVHAGLRLNQVAYTPDHVDGEVRGFFVLVTDITESRAGQSELYASEQRYRTLVEHLPRAAISFVDRDLVLTWMGGGVPQAANLDSADYVGHPIREASGGGEHGEMIESLYRRAIAGEDVSAEIHSPTTGRDFSFQIAPLLDSDGAVTGALGVAQDITDRKHAEADLVDERRLLAESQTFAQLGSWEYRLRDGREEHGRWSAQMWVISGLDPQADPPPLVGMFANVHPDDRERAVTRLQNAIRACEPIRKEFRVLRPDGATVHVELRADVAFDELGVPCAVRGTAQDVTRQRAVREQLRAATERAERIFDDAPIGMAVVSLDGCVERANQALCVMLDHSEEQLLGAHFQKLTHPDDLEKDRSELKRLLAGETDGYQIEKRYTTSTGSLVWASLSVSLLRDHHGRPERFISQVEDITDRVERDRDEQALAAVTTLVATGADSREIFSVVAEQVQLLLEADIAVVVRCEPRSRQGIVVGAHPSDRPDVVGGILSLDGDSASALAVATGKPARVSAPDGNFETGGDMSASSLSGGIAAPVCVDGKIWGTVGAGYSGSQLPAGGERRIARFSSMVGLAISNAEAWERLAREASTDALTGLANRRAFRDRLDAETERARRHDRPLSLAIFDLDHFKQVNDRYGHHAGDEVLAAFGKLLRQHAREGEMVARLGGEEFVWLMPETLGRGSVVAAERLRRAVEEASFEGVGQITLSGGICSMEDVPGTEELMRFADQALYRAKSEGRNRVVLHSRSEQALPLP